MKTPQQSRLRYKFTAFEREDILKQFVLNNPQTRHTRRRHEFSSGSAESSFSHLNSYKLNKGKKHLLQEQRNTEIQRSNRILHQKLAKCANRSQPNSLKASQINTINTIQLEKSRSKSKNKSKKLKTNPTLPTINNSFQIQQASRAKSKDKEKMTLFMGHSHIDEVEFKIKIVISDGIYYLIAQNQHTKIVMQIPEEQYWPLHYNQFQENPCNIFKYLKIQKGQISFRVQKEKEKKKKRKAKHFQDELPQGVGERKRTTHSAERQQKLPKI